MNKKNTSKIIFKVTFYFISLWLLFFLGAISTVTLFKDGHFIGKENILKNNIFTIILLVLSVISLSLTKVINHSRKGALCPSYKITSVKNENYEVMTFIATYIIPLVCINLTEIKFFIIFLLLVITLGVIVTKMDLYMANPTLALLGYKLYSIEVAGEPNKTYIVITKDIINKDDNIEWKSLDNERWYVRKV